VHTLNYLTTAFLARRRLITTYPTQHLIAPTQPTMASVTSLDQDMRKLRMDRYTPQAANEVRSWIEGVLGDRLPAGDLLDALKDGTALCRYAAYLNSQVVGTEN
jgi:hypothetical protein